MGRFDPRHALLALALLPGGDASLLSENGPAAWTEMQLATLKQWVDRAPEDGLPRLDRRPLALAERRMHPIAVDQAADALALKLARHHVLGAAGAAQRVDWHIPDPDRTDDLPQRLAQARAENQLDNFFASLRPVHPAYEALRKALATEADPQRRAVLARNMERWRWLPQMLGDDYLIANAAGFEVTLWHGAERVKSWAAISGKIKTPTPSLAAKVVAVNFNPWWEVPKSIAEESRLSARGSYVWSGTHFRQKPGPGNALGQMKLVMPNPYNIYLHDTPSRGLFGAEQRAFSHGCIRVSDALGFAETLLGGARSKAQIDKIIADEQSLSVPLPRPLPVFVAYFTAEPRADGSIAWHRDIYRRDPAIVSIDPGEPPPPAPTTPTPEQSAQ